MSVIFKTFDVIEIDGIASGNIVDVISNHAPRRAEVLAAYGVYVAAMQTEINAEKTQLQADKTQLTTDLATANASITTLTSEKQQLNNQNGTLSNGLADMTTKRDELFGETVTLKADIRERDDKIAFLQSIRTYDPNQIRSLAFYDRISKDQINKLGLLAIDDPQAAEIHKLLNAYKDNPWPVLLDDPLVVGGIQYLLHIEIITQQEAAQITRPASREEAYIAP